MKSATLSGREILERGTNYQYIVPVYQRNYSWEEKHYEQFLKDILDIGKKNRQGIPITHYMSSFVYQVAVADGTTYYRLVDGQQRIATFYLLLLALKNQNLLLANNYFKNEVSDYNGSSRYHLRLNHDDNEIFRLILTAPTNINAKQKENRLYKAYLYFTEQISSEDEDAKQEYTETLLAGLQALLFVAIGLDETDDATRIFESLNSTGKGLELVELVHNYLLMYVSNPDDQEILNRDYYQKMLVDEKFFNDDPATMGTFLHQYLIVKNNKDLPSGVYPSFKQLFPFTVATPTAEIEELLKEIYQYAGYYVAMFHGKEDDEELRAYFKRLSWIPYMGHWRPLLLNLYRDYTEQKLPKEEFLVMLKLVCSYLLRRKLHNRQDLSDYQKLYKLYNEIKPKNNEPNGYLVNLCQFMRELWGREGIQQFYSNEKMYADVITTYSFYELHRCKQILLDLENACSEEGVRILDASKMTIEHIFSQTPKEESITEFLNGKEAGEGEGQIKLWLYKHLLGNLTFTDYNSQLSNRPFIEKKTTLKGLMPAPTHSINLLETMIHGPTKMFLPVQNF